MKKILTHPYFQIHLCVFLWGFSAILGKLIALEALPLVFIRVALVVLMLSMVPLVWKGLCQFKGADFFWVSVIGCVVCVHWLLFYWSIKLSNASVATICVALSVVFVAVIEPFVMQRPFKIMELFLGLLTIPGVIFVVGGIPQGMILGVLLGVFSALLVSIFAAMNKRFTAHLNALSVTFFELLCGGIFLFILSLIVPSFPFVLQIPKSMDWLWLLLLAVFCTLLPFTLSVHAIKKVSAFNLQLSINLEPIYTILLAILFFGEQRELSLYFYIGVMLILGSVLAQPLFEKYQNKT